MVAQFIVRAKAVGSPSPQTVCNFAFWPDIPLKRGTCLMNGVVAWVPPNLGAEQGVLMFPRLLRARVPRAHTCSVRLGPRY